MDPYSLGCKLYMSLSIVLMRVVFVAAVIGVSLIPGVTTLGALLLLLLLVASLLAMLTLLPIWSPPAEQRRRSSGPSGRPSGDRFPLRPLPFGSPLAAEEQIPGA